MSGTLSKEDRRGLPSPLLAKFFTTDYSRVLKKAESSGFISLGEIVSVIKVGVARNPAELAQATALMGANLQLLGVTLLKQGLAEKVGQNKTFHEKKRGQSRVEKIASEVRETTNSILKIYSRDIQGFEAVSKEEVSRILKEGGPESRNRIAEHLLGFVLGMARKFEGRGVDYLDLVQEGSLGLLTAAKTFDPSKGFKLKTHAYNWIRKFMLDSIYDHANDVRVPRSLQGESRSVIKVSSKLATKLGRWPTTAEIATESNLKIHVVSHALARFQSGYQYFDKPADVVETSDSSYLHDVTEDIGSIRPDILLEAKKELEKTHSHLRDFFEKLRTLKLSRGHIKVFRMRYGFDDYSFQPKLYQAVAEHFSIPLGTVKARIHRVWLKLDELGFKGGDQWLSREFDKLFELENLTGEIVDLQSFKNASD